MGGQDMGAGATQGGRRTRLDSGVARGRNLQVKSEAVR